VSIKERISLTRQEHIYTVLKEDTKDDKCGWSYAQQIQRNHYF
jgi:hypothetical protein